MNVGSTELKILQVTQPYVYQGYSQIAITSISIGRVSILKAYRYRHIFLSYIYFVVFFVYLHYLSAVMYG